MEVPGGDLHFGFEGDGEPEDEALLVTVPGPYHLGAVCVTHDQYKLCVPEFQSRWDREEIGETGALPVTDISHHDAVLYGRWLTEVWRERFDWSGEVRLPREAEWELACRMGGLGSDEDEVSVSYRSYWFGDSEEELTKYARFDKGWEEGPWPVASGEGSPGLFDMHGNVWEWCEDWWSESPLDERQPGGPASGAQRVLRGGSYHVSAEHCASAIRVWGLPRYADGDDGFRLLLSAPPPASDFEPRT